MFDNTITNTALLALITDGKDADGKAYATLAMRAARGGKKAAKRLAQADAHLKGGAKPAPKATVAAPAEPPKTHEQLVAAYLELGKKRGVQWLMNMRKNSHKPAKQAALDAAIASCPAKAQMVRVDVSLLSAAVRKKLGI
jgi:hypothetical protein